MSLYGLTKKQLGIRRAFCGVWGHDERVVNFIGIGTLTQCQCCGKELFASPCRSDEPLIREQWAKDHADSLARWLGH